MPVVPKGRPNKLRDSSSFSSSCEASPPIKKSGGQIDRSKDADHFEWRMNMWLYGKIGNQQKGESSRQYQVIGHLGDGTFGRALKVFDPTDKKDYAVKVIRAVERYTDSARIEIDILNDMKKQGGCE